MSPKEGMYYLGMIIGMVAGVSTARALGWHQLVGLGCGVALGIGLGVLSERMYTGATKKSAPANLKTCDNPNCQWTGTPGLDNICPRCGRSLA